LLDEKGLPHWAFAKMPNGVNLFYSPMAFGP